MSVSSKLLVLAVVLGVVLSLTGIDLLLQTEGNPLLGIPYPPEFLDRYWTELPAAGITLIGAGSVLVIAPAVWLVARLRRRPDIDYNIKNIPGRAETESYRFEADEYDIDENESELNLGQEPSYAEKRTFISEEGERVFKKVPTEHFKGTPDHFRPHHYEIEDDGKKTYTDDSVSMLCPNCGEKANAPFTHCPSCGMKLTSTL